MKKNILKIRLVTSIILLLTTINPIHAQFVSASQTDLAGGIYVTPYNTGNDIFNDGSNIYRVSVCGDLNNSSPSLVWDVDYGINYQGSVVLATTNDIYYTDVCLVQYSGDIYAEVVFFIGGTSQAVYLQEYIWSTTPSPGFYLNNSTFWSVTGVNAVNIDGDDARNFALVYNDNSNDLHTVTGDCNSFNINNSGTPVTLANKGRVPDVSIFKNGSAHVVYFTYVTTNSTTLKVENCQFSNLASGTNTYGTSLSVNAAASYYYDRPRIATPNSTGTNGEFTVVVQETDHSKSNRIVGFNNSTGTSPIMYNNGVNSPYYDISAEPNYLPAVTYDDQGNTWVGWTFDNNGSALFYANAITPFIIKCDYVGKPYTNANYWVVPVGIGDGAAVDLLSLAGRYGLDQLFLTYYNVGNYFDLNYKKLYPAQPLPVAWLQTWRTKSSAKKIRREFTNFPFTA